MAISKTLLLISVVAKKSLSCIKLTYLWGVFAWVAIDVTGLIEPYLQVPQFWFSWIILLIVDFILGWMKHWKMKDIDPAEEIVAFIFKIIIAMCVYIVFMVLINLEGMILKDHLFLLMQIQLFIFIGGSAINSIHYVTSGRIPPTAWMERFRGFEKTGDMKDLVTGEEGQVGGSKNK